MRSAIVLCFIIALNLPETAQTSNRITVTTDTVEFVMGSGFTAEEAYTRVIARAKRLAVDKASETYIKRYSRVESYKLTQDIIDAVHIGTIVDYNILWKNKDPEESGAQRIVMRAVVECPSIDELRRAVDERAPQNFGVRNGELYVNSYPQGATIFVDGDKQVQRTPYTFRNIPEGEHDITLRLEGYRPKTVSPYISSNDPQMVNVLMQRPKGRLRIESNLRTAIVRIDNEVIGKAPVTSDFLSTGIHDITVYSTDKYEPFTAEAEVFTDQISTIYAKLRKRPGRIIVFLNPGGAEVTLKETRKSVFVDDDYTFRDLEPGDYTISAQKKGHNFADKQVVLKPGKTLQVELFGTKTRHDGIDDDDHGKNRKWLYIGGAAVIAGTAAYFLLSKEEQEQGKLVIKGPVNP